MFYKNVMQCHNNRKDHGYHHPRKQTQNTTPKGFKKEKKKTLQIPIPSNTAHPSSTNPPSRILSLSQRRNPESEP